MRMWGDVFFSLFTNRRTVPENDKVVVKSAAIFLIWCVRASVCPIPLLYKSYEIILYLYVKIVAMYISSGGEDEHLPRFPTAVLRLNSY